MIHIDNFDEIADLEKVSKKLEKIIPVAIRVNMETGVYPSWSRFGFNFDNGQALDAIKRIRAGGRLVVNGLHTHIGTFILEPKAYSRAVEKLMVLAGHVKTIFGKPIEYIDLGGGFASMSRLKGIYQPPEVTVPSIESYAEAICGALLRNLNEEPYPKLYLESGRHLIDEAGYLITSVLSARNLANGQRGYVMDAGVNLLYTSTWYNYNVESETTGSGNFESSTLLGPLCMNIDVLEEVVMLPRLDKGTRLILSPVGAYNMTQSMQFIHTRPATVLIRESGKVDVIRRKESFSDMEIRENIPQDLQQAVNKKFE
jgi:diaminopimelate decarboxylase